jgi:O-antigen ligase
MLRTPHLPQLAWWLFCLTLLLMPLPLGGNRSWVLLIVVPGVLATWALLLASQDSRQQLGRAIQLAGWPLACLAGIAVLQTAQTLTLPASWLAALSPGMAQAWQGQASGSLSLDRFNTQLYATLTLCFASAFVFIQYFALQSARLVKRLMLVLVLAGIFQAVVGIYLYSVKADYTLFYFALQHVRTLGTFTYHNHYAFYLVMALCLGLGLIMAEPATQQSGGWKQQLNKLLAFVESRKMLLRLGLIVIVIALVLTKSRMGNAAFFTALLASMAVYLALVKPRNKNLLWLVASVVIIDIVVLGSWVGLDKVAERIGNTALSKNSATLSAMVRGQQNSAEWPRDESVEARLLPADYAVNIIKDYPLTGTGAGTFYTIFPSYKPATVNHFYDHAHNDYVELLTDHGFIGISLFAALVLCVIARTIGVLRHRKSALAKGLAFSTIMACCAALLHSLVDFNLQQPTNAMLFTCILGLGWSAGFIERPARQL